MSNQQHFVTGYCPTHKRHEKIGPYSSPSAARDKATELVHRKGWSSVRIDFLSVDRLPHHVEETNQ